MEPLVWIVGLLAFGLLLWLSVKWLVLPIEMNKGIREIVKELQAINAKLSAPSSAAPAVTERAAPREPAAPRQFTYSCQHCAGEFEADPRTPHVMCPHCQQSTIPQSPLHH